MGRARGNQPPSVTPESASAQFARLFGTRRHNRLVALPGDEKLFIDIEDHNTITYRLYKGGPLHRDGGPAVVRGTYREWWRNGKKHRTDGPAVEGGDGSREYWADGDFIRIEGYID